MLFRSPISRTPKRPSVGTELIPIKLLAGTLFAAGSVGKIPGFALKRGTLLLAREPEHVPVTFQDSGEHTLLFLTLLENHLRHEHPSLTSVLCRGLSLRRGSSLRRGPKARRYCGDLSCGGTGEILVYA